MAFLFRLGQRVLPSFGARLFLTGVRQGHAQVEGGLRDLAGLLLAEELGAERIAGY